MRKIESAIAIAFSVFISSANASVTMVGTPDLTEYSLADINGSGAGTLGTFDIDTGATGWVETDPNNLSASSGGTAITMTTIGGSLEAGTIADARYGTEAGGTTETNGALIRARTPGTGFNLSVTPGNAGSGSITVHMGSWTSGVDYDFNGTTGSIQPSSYHLLREGLVVFDFTTTDAADTIDLNLTMSGGSSTIYTGGARLDFTPVPDPTPAVFPGIEASPSTAPSPGFGLAVPLGLAVLLGLGGLTLMLRRHK